MLGDFDIDSVFDVEVSGMTLLSNSNRQRMCLQGGPVRPVGAGNERQGGGAPPAGVCPPPSSTVRPRGGASPHSLMKGLVGFSSLRFQMFLSLSVTKTYNHQVHSWESWRFKPISLDFSQKYVIIRKC